MADCNEILLIKCGELALKGLNRGTFEAVLMKNLRRRLTPLGHFHLRKAQSTIYIEPQDDAADLDEACDRVSRVFGLSAFSRARMVPKEMEAIREAAASYLKPALTQARTFKVEARRSDKEFPLKSPDICANVGGCLLEAYPHLRVDVHQPDVVVMVEIRDFGAYVHAAQLPGAGGMPVGGPADLGRHRFPRGRLHDGQAGHRADLRAFRLPALYQRAGGDEGGLPS